MKWCVLFLILAIMLVGLLTGCASHGPLTNYEGQKTTSAGSNATAKNETVLFIITQNNFRDEELFTPEEILERAGYKVDVASLTTELAKGVLGARVRPDLAVRDARINDYALIVVVGGSGSPELANHQEVLSLLRQAKAKEVKLAAICLGPYTLAKAGVLQGMKATVFRTADSIAALQQGGALLSNEGMVFDTNLVTADGPEHSQEFGNALVSLLQG